MKIFEKIIMKGIFEVIENFIFKKTKKSLYFNSDDINCTFIYLDLDQLDIAELIVELEMKYDIVIDDKFLSEYITVNISQLIEEVYNKQKEKYKN